MVNSKSWTALETAEQFGSPQRVLAVAGEAEMLTTAQKPVLTEAVPQGFNPRDLLLTLSVETHGIGGDIVNWQKVSFTKPVSNKEYDSVTILGDADPVTVPVEQTID